MSATTPTPLPITGVTISLRPSSSGAGGPAAAGAAAAQARTATNVRYIATPILGGELRIGSNKAMSESKKGKGPEGEAHMRTLAAFHAECRTRHAQGNPDNKVVINAKTLEITCNGVVVETLSSEDPQARAVRDAVQGILGLKEKMWDSYKEGERASTAAPIGFDSKNKRERVEFSKDKQVAALQRQNLQSNEKLYRIKRHKGLVFLRTVIDDILERRREKAAQDTSAEGKRKLKGIEKAQNQLEALHTSAMEFEAYHPLELLGMTDDAEKERALREKQAAAAAWIQDSPMPRGTIFRETADESEDKAQAQAFALLSFTHRIEYEGARKMLEAKPTRAGGEALLTKLADLAAKGGGLNPDAILEGPLFTSLFGSLDAEAKEDLRTSIRQILDHLDRQLSPIDDQNRTDAELIEAVDAALAPRAPAHAAHGAAP
jgi:hypothetical protein